METKKLQDTLTSFFYDLVKAVPAGTINDIIMNTVVSGKGTGEPLEVSYCDEELRQYAASCAQQLIEYRTKYTIKQLATMGRPKVVPCDVPGKETEMKHCQDKEVSKALDMCFIAILSTWSHDFRTKVFTSKDIKRMVENCGRHERNYSVDDDIIPAVKLLRQFQKQLGRSEED